MGPLALLVFAYVLFTLPLFSAFYFFMILYSAITAQINSKHFKIPQIAHLQLSQKHLRIIGFK